MFSVDYTVLVAWIVAVILLGLKRVLSLHRRGSGSGDKAAGPRRDGADMFLRHRPQPPAGQGVSSSDAPCRTPDPVYRS